MIGAMQTSKGQNICTVCLVSVGRDAPWARAQGLSNQSVGMQPAARDDAE